MGIEPTSDSDCRSTVLKLDKRTSLAWIETAFPQVSDLMSCPLLSPADPSVPLVMAREWHAEINSGAREHTGNRARPVAPGRYSVLVPVMIGVWVRTAQCRTCPPS
jgi:hypothetical protein